MEQELAILASEIIGKTLHLGPLVVPGLLTLSQEPSNELLAQVVRDICFVLPAIPALMIVVMAIFQTVKEVDEGPDQSETLH